MTRRVATRRIDVDTHIYPPVDYKALRQYLPRGLVTQAQDMLVRDAMRAAEPDRVAAETSGSAPPSQCGSDPHRDPEARVAAMAQTGFDMQVLFPDALFANLYDALPCAPARPTGPCKPATHLDLTSASTVSDRARLLA
jgi:hypothetical protein